nr:MAG TPA: hypothetical protein [Caudoviricetes sp.]
MQNAIKSMFLFRAKTQYSINLSTKRVQKISLPIKVGLF